MSDLKFTTAGNYMKTKVVINASYGGFGLSDEALKLLGYEDQLEYKFDDDRPSRHDPHLVEVVEKLGDAANGMHADLEIVEVEGNRYRICEYDGLEWVETPESIEWIEV